MTQLAFAQIIAVSSILLVSICVYLEIKHLFFTDLLTAIYKGTARFLLHSPDWAIKYSWRAIRFIIVVIPVSIIVPIKNSWKDEMKKRQQRR